MNLPDIDPQSEEQKITTFIKKVFDDTGKQKAVVAVSGGIDSATTLTLTTKSLNPQNILTLHLPSKTTDPKNSHDAQKVIDFCQIPKENQTTINIGSIIQKNWRIISHYSDSETHHPKGTENKSEKNSQIAKLNKLRLANIAARSRMIVIYDHAKRYDALVVGTENYSEHLLGYFTRFGDEASDLEPIKHLYKSQLYDLARHLQIPQEIIDKTPTADLWKGQSDESELGFSYNQADPILHMIDQGKSKQEIVDSGQNQELVEKVTSQFNYSNFKHHVPYKI